MNKIVKNSIVKNNIRAYRVWKRISQSEMAKILGISICTYRRIENGYFPKADIRIKICNFFDVEPYQIFDSLRPLDEYENKT